MNRDRVRVAPRIKSIVNQNKKNSDCRVQRSTTCLSTYRYMRICFVGFLWNVHPWNGGESKAAPSFLVCCLTLLSTKVNQTHLLALRVNSGPVRLSNEVE